MEGATRSRRLSLEALNALKRIQALRQAAATDIQSITGRQASFHQAHPPAPTPQQAAVPWDTTPPGSWRMGSVEQNVLSEGSPSMTPEFKGIAVRQSASDINAAASHSSFMMAGKEIAASNGSADAFDARTRSAGLLETLSTMAISSARGSGPGNAHVAHVTRLVEEEGDARSVNSSGTTGHVVEYESGDEAPGRLMPGARRFSLPLPADLRRAAAAAVPALPLGDMPGAATCVTVPETEQRSGGQGRGGGEERPNHVASEPHLDARVRTSSPGNPAVPVGRRVGATRSPPLAATGTASRAASTGAGAAFRGQQHGSTPVRQQAHRLSRHVHPVSSDVTNVISRAAVVVGRGDAHQSLPTPAATATINSGSGGSGIDQRGPRSAAEVAAVTGTVGGGSQLREAPAGGRREPSPTRVTDFVSYRYPVAAPLSARSAPGNEAIQGVGGGGGDVGLMRLASPSTAHGDAYPGYSGRGAVYTSHVPLEAHGAEEGDDSDKRVRMLQSDVRTPPVHMDHDHTQARAHSNRHTESTAFDRTLGGGSETSQALIQTAMRKVWGLHKLVQLVRGRDIKRLARGFFTWREWVRTDVAVESTMALYSSVLDAGERTGMGSQFNLGGAYQGTNGAVANLQQPATQFAREDGPGDRQHQYGEYERGRAVYARTQSRSPHTESRGRGGDHASSHRSQSPSVGVRKARVPSRDELFHHWRTWQAASGKAPTPLNARTSNPPQAFTHNDARQGTTVGADSDGRLHRPSSVGAGTRRGERQISKLSPGDLSARPIEMSRLPSGKRIPRVEIVMDDSASNTPFADVAVVRVEHNHKGIRAPGDIEIVTSGDLAHGTPYRPQQPDTDSVNDEASLTMVRVSADDASTPLRVVPLDALGRPTRTSYSRSEYWRQVAKADSRAERLKEEWKRQSGSSSSAPLGEHSSREEYNHTPGTHRNAATANNPGAPATTFAAKRSPIPPPLPGLNGRAPVRVDDTNLQGTSSSGRGERHGQAVAYVSAALTSGSPHSSTALSSQAATRSGTPAATTPMSPSRSRTGSPRRRGSVLGSVLDMAEQLDGGGGGNALSRLFTTTPLAARRGSGMRNSASFGSSVVQVVSGNGMAGPTIEEVTRIPNSAAAVSGGIGGSDAASTAGFSATSTSATRASREMSAALEATDTTDDRAEARRYTLGLPPRSQTARERSLSRTRQPNTMTGTSGRIVTGVSTLDGTTPGSLSGRPAPLLHTLATSLRDGQSHAAANRQALPMRAGDVVTAIEQTGISGASGYISPALAASIPADGRHVYVVHEGVVNKSSMGSIKSPSRLRDGMGATGMNTPASPASLAAVLTQRLHGASPSPMLGSRVTEKTTIASERTVGSIQIRDIQHQATAVDAFGVHMR